MFSTVPTRCEVPESDKWDLTQLFTDVGKWQDDFAWLQQTYPKFQEWKGKVGETAQTLAAVLEFEKSLELKIERVYHYASLELAEDSTNNEYLVRVGQVQNLLTKIGEVSAFVVPEILAIDDEVDVAVAGMTALIEPMLMVFLGVVVGGFLIALYLPFFSIAGAIK